MHLLSRVFASVTVVLAGFLSAPAVNALPVSGVLKNLAVTRSGDAPVLNKQKKLAGMIEEAGYRIHIGFGRHFNRYDGYPSYGYRRSYRPHRHYRSHRYYRPYRVYRPHRHYRRHRYSRRYKHRRLRRNLHHLRHILRNF